MGAQRDSMVSERVVEVAEGVERQGFRRGEAARCRVPEKETDYRSVEYLGQRSGQLHCGD